MKNLLFVLMSVLIFSCSTSDGDSGSSDFNPPAWAQGTWILEGTTQGQGTGFRLSEHNFCTIIFTSEQCQQEMLNLMRKSNQTVSVNETISNSVYVAKIIYYGGTSVTHSFEKLSNTEIEYNGTVFIKQ